MDCDKGNEQREAIWKERKRRKKEKREEEGKEIEIEIETQKAPQWPHQRTYRWKIMFGLIAEKERRAS